MNGIIKFFNNKGFGFIKVKGMKDVFIHKSGVVKGYEPHKDDTVEFILIHEDKGDAAQDVRKIS